MAARTSRSSPTWCSCATRTEAAKPASAAERRVVLQGFGTEDSHHAIHAFTWGPGGDLYFQEGTFLHSQVETPYGTVRLEEAGVFRSDTRTEKLSAVVSHGSATR